MNLYSVHFNGYWPVGAVAVVVADSLTTAEKHFNLHMTINYADLMSENPEGLGVRVELLRTGLNLAAPSVHVLLDGNY